VSKGRSSSFSLNLWLRKLLPYLLAGQLYLALVWISTGIDPADHPSRGRGLPLPRCPPSWAQKYFPGRSLRGLGLEIFAGTAGITAAFRSLGYSVLDPVDILYGVDVMSGLVDELIRDFLLVWIWASPPCSSFTALRNFEKGGPLRPRGMPEGPPDCPATILGNNLWNRCLRVCELALRRGTYIVIEHPACSRAWQLRTTMSFIGKFKLFYLSCDQCMYQQPTVARFNRKPTRLLTSAFWLRPGCLKCNGSHLHGPPLRGRAAAAAAAYPPLFCQAMAHAFEQWERSGASKPSAPSRCQ
jgi:hypothetical protein